MDIRHESLYLRDIKNRYFICVRNFEGHVLSHPTVVCYLVKFHATNLKVTPLGGRATPNTFLRGLDPTAPLIRHLVTKNFFNFGNPSIEIPNAATGKRGISNFFTIEELDIFLASPLHPGA